MNKLTILFAIAALGASASLAQDIDDPYVGPILEPRELQPAPSFFEEDFDNLAISRVIQARIDFEPLLMFKPQLAMIGYSADLRTKPWKEFIVALSYDHGVVIQGGQYNPPMEAFLDLAWLRLIADVDQMHGLAVTDREVAERKKAYEAARDRLLAQREHRKFEQCSVSIDQQRVERLEAIWHTMLIRTRVVEADFVDLQSKPNIDRDPLEYHFMARNLVGRASAPALGFKPAAFAALGTAMFEYCMTKQNEALLRMDTKLSELEGLLAKDGVNLKR